MTFHTAELRSSNNSGSTVNRICLEQIEKKNTEEKAKTLFHSRSYLRVHLVKCINPQPK